MKEYIEIYNTHREKIESFIETSVINVDKFNIINDDLYNKLFNTFPSLEVVYVVDAISKIQTSANIYAKNQDEKEKDKSRNYLINKLKIKENNFAFTDPYQSAATGTICVTVSKKEGNNIIFMDFVLEKLLEKLGLIEKHIYFSKIIKSFYFVAGFFMMLLSVAAIVYGAYDFVKNIMYDSLSIDAIFKPVIATTLGLAIFDLAKTILEQEVFFKSYLKDSKIEIQILTKFIITILIALSIETLMVVFKIAIENYDKMINALYLMGGISFIIIALAALIYLTKKR